jgi:two-component system phosphate regulon sensor histidine kinase PhoR
LRAVETDVGGGVLVCFEDVTHLEQAGQMRRDFVANVSHELRTPLTALLGFIETLRGPALGDVVATDRFLSMMQAEAERMEHLVHDLLSLSRVEAQERVRPTEPVDLNAMIGSVIHGLRPLARQSDVEIAADQPDTALTVPGDAEQLRQVVSNLIENAIKYGGQGKTIHVRLETTESEPLVRGPAAVITVRDEGPGIAPEHIPRLTERFYRVDSHRSRAMGGTGLGLAIVKHIVGRHRGRLRIESTPGRGGHVPGHPATRSDVPGTGRHLIFKSLSTPPGANRQCFPRIPGGYAMQVGSPSERASAAVMKPLQSCNKSVAWEV